jgi:glycosyltransferase involved in cell wall biosynthesis
MQILRLNCKAFMLPSQFEGFGLPLVEAIYHHRPAIVSAIPPHRETLDRYPQYRLATLFPPASAEALAAALNQSPAESSPMPAGWRKGVEKTWSWADTVGRILQGMK